MTTPVEQIAATVLYEGYVLWPYRRSSRKNQKRWTFGGVYPRAYSEAGHADDPWLMQTQCLVAGADPVVDVTIRFLQLVQRRAARRDADGALELVDELRAGDERYLSWDEATERAIAVERLPLATLDAPRHLPIAIAAGREEEPVRAPDGTAVGAMLRSWDALEGDVAIAAEPLAPGLTRLTVRIANATPWQNGKHDDALKQSLISTHTILAVTAGEFVSLLEPPAALQPAAAACQNIKTWPVLVGEAGERTTLLSSPIILYDYPQIAPESLGDLFDGTEIDELLALNILALTDAEKAEMRASDPRAREILERTEAMTPYDFMQLHGTFRDVGMEPAFDRPAAAEHADPFGFDLEQPAPERVSLGGIAIARGSRVRLHPRAGGDIMDIALAGKVAVVAAIEQDYEERIHLAVTLEDDPGRDLGEERQVGHRFFFSADEVEPLDEVEVRDGVEAGGGGNG